MCLYFQVENVSRFLYFVNNEEASLQFVYQRQKLDVFLKEITGLTKRTQSNYLKSLKRFLNFHTDRTNLHSMDADLHEECTEYSRVLTSTLRLLSKQAKKEIFQKRFDYCSCINGHLLHGPLISSCCNLSTFNTGAFTKILVSHITFFTLLFFSQARLSDGRKCVDN